MSIYLGGLLSSMADPKRVKRKRERREWLQCAGIDFQINWSSLQYKIMKTRRDYLLNQSAVHAPSIYEIAMVDVSWKK